VASLVYLKNKKNNVTYVYENTSVWDKEKKKCRCSRKCIGHKDTGTGEIVHNERRTKEIVPVKPAAHVTSVGNALIYDRICSSIALTSVLKKAFPDDWTQILTCAYYLIGEGKALSHCGTWSAAHKNPYGGELTGQRISELLTRLTRDKQMDFFKLWVKQRLEKEYIAMDITSVSSYSKQNEYVRYGYNRDGEDLPQINLCMLLGEESRIPLFYELLPGSIHDVSTLKSVLKKAEWMGASGIHAVMDKGFCSEANIDSMYESAMHFMIGMSFVSKYAKDCVAKAKEDITHHNNYRCISGDDIFVKSWCDNWKGHRLYVHVYYDSEKADAEYKKFLKELEQCRLELLSGQKEKKHEAWYKDCFIVKETPVRGIKISYRDDAIDRYRNNTAGYFVLVSNDIKDPVDALKIYRCKDEIEKSFDDLKNTLDCRRLRIQSESAMQGRLFIQFIALIIMNKMRSFIDGTELYRNNTLPEIINEMSTLHEVTVSDRHGCIYSPLSKLQSEILKAFAIDIAPYV